MRRSLVSIATVALVALSLVSSAEAGNPRAGAPRATGALPQEATLIGGSIPAEGGVALLSVTADAGLADVVSELAVGGCDARAVQVAEGGSWTTFVRGAPDFVNSSFPATLASGDTFAASCEPTDGTFWLTVLHHNDGESQLLGTGTADEPYGGVARFKTLADDLREGAILGGFGLRGALLISAGDNYLAGPEFTASQTAGVPFYDSVALDLIGYDALAIGNHEFDFGPDVLADFIEGFGDDAPPFVSANLDVSAEPRLQALVDSGVITSSVVVTKAGRQIGIVGATTTDLPFISSPRNVVVSSVAGAVQAEVDALTAQGVNIVILTSHLQGLSEDQALLPLLTGVDIAIAGGGDELLANAGDLLIPGDEDLVQGAYPMVVTAADGASVPVVTGPGNYTYLGRLVARFDAAGNLLVTDAASGPVRVSGTGADAVAPDAAVLAAVAAPVSAFVADLANTVVGTSEVALNGVRDPGVRTQETNEGNLLADALLWKAQQLAPDFGVAAPSIAIQNGGGIRNSSVIPAGDITELTTFDVAPFANFVVVMELTPAQLKDVLENCVSQVEDASGRFGQIAGFSFTWDSAGDPRTFDDDGGVTFAGARILEVTLDDGTPIVVNGAVAANAPNVGLATIDFLARGGDQYPLDGIDFTVLGASYQQALRDYIVDALGGAITAAAYPEGGAGRITAE
jgi:5'-nucleotidase